MLRDRVDEYYYSGQDYNCAETILHAVNDEYHLGLTDEEIKLVSGFGAGMGCGHACGTLCASIAALGKMLVDQKAHYTEGFGDKCKMFVEDFQADMGSTFCEELKKLYRRDDTGCLETEEKAADIFERYCRDKLNYEDE